MIKCINVCQRQFCFRLPNEKEIYAKSSTTTENTLLDLLTFCKVPTEKLGYFKIANKFYSLFTPRGCYNFYKPDTEIINVNVYSGRTRTMQEVEKMEEPPPPAFRMSLQHKYKRKHIPGLELLKSVPPVNFQKPPQMPMPMPMPMSSEIVGEKRRQDKQQSRNKKKKKRKVSARVCFNSYCVYNNEQMF